LDSFNGAIERWTRLVLRTRSLVLGFWLVVLIAGGLASTRLGALLSNGFGISGSDSAQAQAVLARQFGDRSGIGGFVIPLISVGAALTLLPALLSLYGRGGAARTPIAQLARDRLRIPLPPSSRTISSHKRQRG
jgi:uncharacterized membrane protein YdfJ with MMPL/SSD domain